MALPFRQIPPWRQVAGCDPSAETFAAAKSIYAELVGLEREIEGDDVCKRRESIAASGVRLGELLAAAGFANYRAFMRTALLSDVAARAAALPADHHHALATPPPASSRFVDDVLDGYRLIASFFADLIGDFARYADTGRTLANSSYLV